MHREPVLQLRRFRSRAALLLAGLWLPACPQPEVSGPCPSVTQREYTEPAPVLDRDGDLAAQGWARTALFEYDRERVHPARRPRLKEWNFVNVATPQLSLSVTLADISWLVLVTVDFVDFESEERRGTATFASPGDGSLLLPPSPYEPASFEQAGVTVTMDWRDGARHIDLVFPEGFGPAFQASLVAEEGPGEEHLAAVTRFSTAGGFFYQNKIVAMPASGEITVGDDTYALPPGQSFATLDWGRGVYPEEFAWAWAYAAGIQNGQRIGLNIGFGDGDDQYGTENAVIVDGVLDKHCRVDWEFDREDVMKPWRFRSRDDRLDLILDPFYDLSRALDLGDFYADYACVHGTLSGSITLENGDVLAVDGLYGLAEHARQRW